MSASENQIVVCQPNEAVQIDVRLENETVWLTQSQMGELFGCTARNVSMHLDNIYSCGEDRIAAELYIPNDKDLFHQLFEDRSKIESECGFPFDWKELPEGKASRIVAATSKKWQNIEGQKECFTWLCAKALAIRKAISKYV